MFKCTYLLDHAIYNMSYDNNIIYYISTDGFAKHRYEHGTPFHI